MPNADIHHWLPEYKASQRPRLRKDGALCCPAMLQVNRQIYAELVREWYSHATYLVTIGAGLNRLGFLDMRLAPNDAFPCQLKYVRHIRLYVQPLARLGPFKCPNQIDITADLASLLCQPHTSLQTVALTVHISPRVVRRTMSQPEKIDEYLELNLSPLRQVRDLTKASSKIRISCVLLGGFTVGADVIDEITLRSDAFLGLLCEEMEGLF